MEKLETKYKYAIVYSVTRKEYPYDWSKHSKYKTLEAVEMAYKDLSQRKVTDWIYKIVPYFEGHWWSDYEEERKQYLETNQKMWEFLRDKGLDDECRKFIKNRKTRNPYLWCNFLSKKSK